MMFLSKFEPHQNKLVFSHHREERASESERAVLPLAMLIFPRVCVPVFMSFCVYIFIIHLCVTIYTYGIKEYGRTRQLSIGHTAFLCGGKGFLLAFIAHISSLFQIEFLAQHKNKNARQNQTQKEIFVFVSIDWLVSLSLPLTLSVSFSFCFSITPLHIDYCATFQSFRDPSRLKRVKCLLKMPYKMFGLMKSYYIKPGQT